MMRAVRLTPLTRACVGAWLGLVLGLFLALAAGVAPALAHAQLVDTTPENGAVLDAAPASVDLVFNEPVQQLDGALRLFGGSSGGGGSGGAAAPVVLDGAVSDATASVVLPADLAGGSYALSYRFVSADGHPVSGVVAFQVGEGPFDAPNLGVAAADPKVSEIIASAVTGLQYLGLLVLAGLLFFQAFVLRGRSTTDWRTRKLLRYGYGTAAAGALLLLPAAGSRVTGNQFITFDPEMGDFTILPPSVWWGGVSWQVVASAAIIVVFGLVALLVSGRARSRGGNIVAVVAAAIALAAPVLVGHTQTVQPIGVMMAADVVHLFVAAFWVGGVVGLLRFFVADGPARSEPGEEAGGGAGPATSASVPVSPRRAAQVVVDFSRFAAYSVIALAVSGLVMAVLVVGSWSTLFSTAYGTTLLIKVGVVAVVLALAAWNRFFLIPQLVARPEPLRQWSVLRRITGIEVAVLICVIAVTGFLTNTSPNAASNGSGSGSAGTSDIADVSGPSETPVFVESQGLTVDGALAAGPGVSGAGGSTAHNTADYVVRFTLDYDGSPVVPASGASDANGAVSDSVLVEARMQAQDLGPLAADVVFDDATGEYEATLQLPTPGEWQLQFTVRIDTFTQPIAIVRVEVGTS